MTSNLPTLLSVIIPVHNLGKFLPEAVASIEAQGQCPVEIIVVDDGSTDDTPRVIQALGSRVRVITQAQRGASAARNAGIAAARGDWIAFLDADDYWRANKLAIQFGYLMREPQLQMLSGRAEMHFETEQARANWRQPLILHFQLGTVLARRAVFERVGFFDETIPVGEDMDWFTRCVEAELELRLHPETVVAYRRHATNMTNDAQAVRHGLLLVMKRSVDRRRAADGSVKPLKQVEIPK